MVVTGGGTGGHLFPMRAIADAWARRRPDVPVYFVGSQRGQDRLVLADRNEPVVLLGGRGIRRSLSPRATVSNLGAVVGIVGAVVGSLVRCLRWRPLAVVSVGGYASFPFSLAAVICRRPLVLVELDAHAGAAQRVLRRFAAVRCTAFAAEGAVTTGVPVRDELVRLAGHRVRAEVEPAIEPGRQVVTVMTGSLGAASVNDAVVDLARRWSERRDVVLVHVTGRRDYDRVSAARPTTTGLDYRVIAFADMVTWWSITDVAVCRAGAATVAELTLLGIPSVLVPLPGAPGDHQSANAAALASCGAATVVADRDCSGERLASELDRILEPSRHAEMSEAAASLGRADAAEAIARVVSEVAS